MLLLASSVCGLFKWRQFEPEVILLAVGWYLRFSLSYREVEELLAERMREHYGLDRLIEYGTQPLPETLVVVNPAWRRLDQSVRRERACFGFKPTSVPAPCPPNPVPSRSRT